MSSFTWSALIYPESTPTGPLFVWSATGCWQRTAVIQFNTNGDLVLGVCDGSSMIWVKSTSTSTGMPINQWHEAAVSFDSTTGSGQISVDGNLQRQNIHLHPQKQVSGPVLMGSRDYSNPNPADRRYFHGKIACVRLWNTARDLSTMRMDTPLCKIY